MTARGRTTIIMHPPNEHSRHIPIPDVFHSLHDGPFDRCMVCDAELLQSRRRYIVERIFRGSEPILEYAMCIDCHGELSDEISKESMAQLQQYFEEHLEWERLFRRSIQVANSTDISTWLEECLLTAEPAADCHERQIFAHFEGDRLLLGEPNFLSPMMLSGKAVEAISEQLSEATRGWMDDFVGEHFGMSPDLIDAPDWTPVLF